MLLYHVVFVVFNLTYNGNRLINLFFSEQQYDYNNFLKKSRMVFQMLLTDMCAA
jgi:hypothetical protein